MRQPKKIVTVGVRMAEELQLKLKAISDVRGLDLSELVRMACSDLVEKERDQYNALHSIFGHESEEEQDEPVQHCATGKSAT